MATPTPNSSGQLTYDATGDITKLVNQIYKQKAPDYTKTAASTTNPIYNPLIADIASQGDAAKKTSAANALGLKQQYGGLIQSIAGDANTIKANTVNAVNAQNSNMQTATSNIGNNFASAQNNTANLLSKLGIQAAAPDALAKGTDSQGFLQGLSALQGQSAANLAGQLGQSSLNYNTAQQHIAGFEENQNLQKNTSNLASTISGLQSQKANVKSQRAQQTATLSQQLRDQFTNSQNSQAGSLVQAFQAQQSMNATLAAAQLSAGASNTAARLNAGATTSAAQIAANAQIASANAASAAQIAQAKIQAKTDAAKIAASLGKSGITKATVGQQIYNYAGSIFGTKTDQASKAVSLANTLLKKNFPNAGAFSDALIHKAGKGAPSAKLQALAYTMWNLLQVNPNIQNYLPAK